MNTFITTAQAAHEIAASLPELRRRVLLAIGMSKAGLTDEQIQRRCRMAGNTERPRRIELLEAGIIRDSGRTRRTASGRMAVVWELVE